VDGALPPVTTTGDVGVDELRSFLEARAQACWLRLEDAVSELAALHGAADEEVVDRVRATLAAERQDGEGVRA